MKIILSTRNPSKAKQIMAMFGDPRIQVITLDEAGIEGQGIEDGNTLVENATKKAQYAFDHRPAAGECWTMADDTGLFLEALGGIPGVHAATWAGNDATTDEITAHILDRLKGHDNRRATFRTVVAVINPEGELIYFSGEVEGEILREKRLASQPKMPYSSLFVPKGHTKVWSEMTVEEENDISHRGKAFRQVREFFEEQFN